MIRQIAPRQMRDPRTYAVLGAAMEVHRGLGCGFLEPVYQEALAVELESRRIPFRSQVELPIMYKGKKLRATYRVDFICFDRAIVELKALSQIDAQEEAQVINYLKASGLEVGLLVNFGAPSLGYKRYAHTPKTCTE